MSVLVTPRLVVWTHLTKPVSCVFRDDLITLTLYNGLGCDALAVFETFMSEHLTAQLFGLQLWGLVWVELSAHNRPVLHFGAHHYHSPMRSESPPIMP